MSLLEALVVLAIVGLIGAIGYPRLEQAYHPLQLREAAQGLVLDLQRVRAAALTSGRPAGLRPVGGGHSGYLLPDGTFRAMPPGGGLTALGEIRFYPDGSSSGGGWVLVAGANSVAVNVESATGMIWRTRS